MNTTKASGKVLYFALSTAKIAELLSTDRSAGLSATEVHSRIKKYGHNRITSKKGTSLVKIFLHQFLNIMIYLLAIAAGISFFFHEWLDGSAILIVILVNVTIGFAMEWQAKRSMDALKKMASVQAKVIRDHHLLEISSEEVVPGDIVFIEAGDMIAADARLIDGQQLQLDESALTGESLPSDKKDGMLAENTTLAERTNMIYKGTYVTKGNGHAIVVGTGMKTELGSIATLVASAEQSVTPLEKKLKAFSKKLIWITAALVVAIFIVGIINGHALIIMLETSIALAVAAIPEGLPIVSTLALARGMIKLSRQNVIVKKLSAVETLGGTTIICTDKTGTLTQNKIEVNIICTADHTYEINGHPDDTFKVPSELSAKKSFDLFRRAAVLCNTAEYSQNNGFHHEVGDPLEIGLLKFAAISGVNIDQLRAQYPKIHEIAFTSEAKVMATLHHDQQSYWIAAKGAAEELITHCSLVFQNQVPVSLTDHGKKEWLKKAEDLSMAGLRVLAFAFRDTKSEETDLLHDLVLLGLIGFLDPPRPDVTEAVAECHAAGIKVVMITGDHPFTARNIAQKLGITSASDAATINGADMHDYEKLSQEEKNRWINASVFARVSPKQKLDLVTILQENNNIVGMTGDGVNDAPALKKSDIGIAMGLRGTQVAQESADMILKDDSFSSIVKAIRQGRTIFENIQKFVMYLLSCNMSELFVVATAGIFNFHFQLVPLQILFINIITDVLPALALGVSSGNNLVMKRPPHDPTMPIMSNRHWRAMITYSIVMSTFVIGAVFISHHTMSNTIEEDTFLCNNILFFTLIFTQLFHVFNMTFGWVSSFKNEVVKNVHVWYALITCSALTYIAYRVAPVNTALGVHSMGFISWALVLAASLGSLVTIQIMKKFKLVL